MRCLTILLAALLSIPSAVAAQVPADPKPAWPHPVPCRVKDSDNRDLFVKTLGDVSPSIADGTFDPLKDEVRLKDGAAISAYYRDKLKVKYFKPIDKSRFPLPPS